MSWKTNRNENVWFTNDELAILIDAYLTYKVDPVSEDEIVSGIQKLADIRISHCLVDAVLDNTLVFGLDEKGELWFRTREHAEENLKRRRMIENLGGYPPTLPVVKSKLIEFRRLYRSLHFQWVHTRPGKVRLTLKKSMAELKEKIHDVEGVFLSLRRTYELEKPVGTDRAVASPGPG